jgi:MoaA/NifB/PqqE/SkfB family radical SAM enzyme
VEIITVPHGEVVPTVFFAVSRKKIGAINFNRNYVISRHVMVRAKLHCFKRKYRKNFARLTTVPIFFGNPISICKSRDKNLKIETSMTALREGRKYPCDQCTYMATAPNALKRHIQSIHELVKHPCDSCSYRQFCGSGYRIA